MPTIILVNASSVLSDSEVAAWVPAFQKFDDDSLAPAWNLDAATYQFMTWASFPWKGADRPPGDVWPLFVNRHSTDPGALGWHTVEQQEVYGRIFAGDCVRYAIAPSVDCAHEAFEMRVDPYTNRTVTLPDGRIALVESCDPVEDDLLAIDVDGVKLSDFVLPTYFGLPAVAGWENRGYDFQAQLKGPCPTLTAGGYQSLLVGGQWTQVTARLLGGPCSYRAERFNAGSHRRRRIAVPIP